MSIDLEPLSLKELKSLHARVSKAIADFDGRRKQTALTELEERARELGFSLSELMGVPATRRRSAATPKYANPADASDTWSGRGRKPRWFEQALKDGASAESMSI